MATLFKRGYEKKKKLKKVATALPLDIQQANAVYSKSSDIIVVAGAGSGKTLSLTERIKHLLDTGVPPSNIVAITFTNMASEEMKERLSNVAGIGDAFIGTIHSFANQVMKLSGMSYRIYDDDIDNAFHQELISKYCKHLTFDRFLKYKDLKKLEITGQISEREVQNFLQPSEMAEMSLITGTNAYKEFKDVNPKDYPKTIRDLCKERDVIDFDKLLKMAEDYFKSINAQVEHVLVDEFQDVGNLEFDFISSLNADNYFLVGDYLQSLYGFKGGNVNIFLKLIEDGDFEVHYLNNNYRNCKEVINMANTISDQIANKIPNHVVPLSEEDGEVNIVSKAKLIKILEDIEESKDYKNWFFLCRTNKEIFELTELCAENLIPCTTFKREGMSLEDLRKRMDSNRVKILTVHTSKGLEIDNVLLYGDFPVSCPSYRKSEDERKVMYVGVTRAKKRLFIVN